MKDNTGDIKVSVVVPVYNAEKYLRRCVDSLLRQTLKRIEIILVDDGSTDDSPMICDDYSAVNSHIRVLHLQNGGPARARNRAIEMASGKYIGFTDADDYVSPDMFEKLYSEAEEQQADITICGYNIDSNGKITEVKLNFELRYEGEDVKNKLLYRYYTNNHNGLYSLWNKLFRRNLLIEHHIRMDETLMRAEDAWFIFDCLKVTQKVVYLPSALYFYYQNTESIMHSFYMDQYEKWRQTREKLLRENETLKFKIDYTEFYEMFLYNVALYCRQMLKLHQTEKVKNVLNDSFYLNAVQYTGRLPLHIKMAHKFAEKHFIEVAVLFYKLWGLRDGKRKKN